MGLLPTSGFSCSPLLSPCSKIPYRLKEMDNEFDNFSQVPESPIGREEEPHLYRVAKKYRKVGKRLCGEHQGSPGVGRCLFHLSHLCSGHHQILQAGAGGF